jgi:hypothetical protein
MAIMAEKKSTASLIILLFISQLFHLHAQEDQYYSTGFIRNDNAVYKENIRTVLLYKAGFELSPPIIQLNTDEKLVLSFDDLDADYKQYRYTLIHCDAFWNKSDLRQMEYIDGFMEDFLSDYKFSFNTVVPYVNYYLVFPTEYLKVKKSGNYIIKVYIDSDDEENVVLTQRLMVYEPRVTVEGRVANSVDLNLRYTHHQVNFKILSGNYFLSDAYSNLHVMVMQNGRWDNMVMNIQPRIFSDSHFDFSLQEKLAFPAGNEYRYFDMKTLKYNTDRMRSLQYTNEGYQVYLMQDLPKTTGNYFYEEDINGRKLIAANETRDPYTEGDYAWVHFSLPYKYPLADGSLYVFGALSDWQFNRSNLMQYNFDLRAYEAKMLLKQGYYNYAYAFLENRSKVGDLTFIEGSFWETRNEYTVFVYHRQQGDSYDQLVGIGFVNSVGQ